MPVYVESNVFIYAVEGSVETAKPAKTLLEFARRQQGAIVTSELTLAEVLAPSRQPDALPGPLKRRLYLDLLVWSGIVTLIPLSRSILIDTADLRAATRLKLPDAIHVLSAIEAKCRFLVSGDRDMDRLPAGMTRVNPDQPSIDHLLKTFG